MAAITARASPDIKIALDEKFYICGNFKNCYTRGPLAIPFFHMNLRLNMLCF